EVVGAAPAEPYARTEREIEERRQRGLFADMRFTMTRTETSCHPERFFDGARSVISAAWCYFAPAPELGLDEGRLPRYAWDDSYRPGALDEPGVLDSTKCLSYWTQAPEPIPEEYRRDLGASVYGCDICQEVCPWNRGIEKRRRQSTVEASATPAVSLRDWLTGDDEQLVRELERLYVPRKDARWLRRNALVAAGNVGSSNLVDAVGELADGED